MDIDRARSELRRLLRDKPWFVGIGIGGPEDNPHLEVRVSDLTDSIQRAIPARIGNISVEVQSTYGHPVAF